ncbi:zinc transporter ZIP4-like [Babylonia areolata]|uniref:zinc transporter ZIP4-like n=1 Tax=Babylonia areolata TaxID=304850 RepID=UPI003FD381BC
MGVRGGVRALLAVVFFTWVCQVAGEGGAPLDVFHEVLERYNVTGTPPILPPASLEHYVDSVLSTLSCVHNGSAVTSLEAETELDSCPHHLCLDTAGLIAITGGNSSLGLTEEQFQSASLVTLGMLSKGKHPCGATLQPDAGARNVSKFRKELVSSVSGGGQLTEDNVQAFLQGLGQFYQGTHHGHDDDHDHDHDHVRRKRSGHDHDHAHEDDHHEGGGATPPVIETKCLSADAVMYYLNADHTTSMDPVKYIDHLATVVIYLMSQASALEGSCRLLPAPQEFLASLTLRLTGHRLGNLTREDLHHLMGKLNIVPGSGQDDHSGHDHAHERRRRSAASADLAVSRVKRETSTSITRCYSPEEMLAVFEVGSTLTPAQLANMCPALLYQQLYSDCTLSSVHDDHSSPYKWWYGSATVLVVCLCSLLGMVLVPCMKRSIYRLGMALFVGLAVGTLTGDALLHLVPTTMGAHAHGEDHVGHSHDGPVVVEKYLWFSLVILAGIYVFYLLETLFVRFWKPKGTCPGTADSRHGHGHDHGMELELTPTTKDLEDSTEAVTGSMALTVMIVVGDAVHNFADGLAIGAAFSNSTAVGIATGIAVFCHELPHELGDFAVLLKNGLTVGKAVFWNLTSSLTAFLGLFVSLALATQGDVQTWIFAVAAGMFLYIALVDLLPQMTSKENCQDTPVYVLNNLGILLGVFLMLIIAIFEERIIID